MVGTGTQGAPHALLRRPTQVFTTADAAAVYAHPRPQLARLAGAGVVHRLAPGLYAVVPPRYAGLAWRPDLEAAAVGIGAALYGPDQAVLMGLSAARVHGVVPRGLATGIVAVPRQRRSIVLQDRDAVVLFVARGVQRLDAELVDTELGRLLVTGVEQTALDLVHRPELGGAPDQAREAATTLLQRCDDAVLGALAEQQRLRAALRRLRALT
jgi:predicted transcriptional regulator of viral defense system